LSEQVVLVSTIAAVDPFAIADESRCLRSKASRYLATMTAIMGSMFRYANRARIFQNADVTGLQLSPQLA
jgi:hypothetical protein